MSYISAKEVAEKWDISQRRVVTLCSNGRIAGATLVGNSWIIPETAIKPIDARTKEATSSKGLSKPFLKWAGGKSQLLKEIEKYYPFEKDGTITKYAEPFVGGGAVLFDILNRYNLTEVYISDINRELITTYITIRDNVDKLIDTLKGLEHQFYLQTPDKRKNEFLVMRSQFNKQKKTYEFPIEIAALMIFLNKTCFNGLYRVNRKGEYNVPFGSYKDKKPVICDEENLRNVSKKLQKVQIVCGDYGKSKSFIDDKTFVYFDPPYRPLTKTASFTSYAENLFNDKNQLELAEFVKHMIEKGAKVVVSNSDPKNTDENDNFFDDAYANQNIQRVSAKRMINRSGKKRGPINELLISNLTIKGEIV